MSTQTALSLPYPVPHNEEERLAELCAQEFACAGRIEQIDRICRLARDLFKVPVSLVTLVESDKQTFLATCGLDITEVSREDAFCSVAILGDRPLVVPDATRDPRFQRNVYVRGAPYIRFYAGVPLTLRPGVNIGTLCIVGMAPRSFTPEDEAHLTALADLIVNELRVRRAARELKAQQTRLKQTAHMSKIGGYEVMLPEGKLVWDDEIYPIFGLPPGTPPSHELIIERYDPEMRERSRRRLAELFTNGTPYDVELRGTRLNGEVFWIRAMAEAEMSGGVVTRVLGAVQDITDRKEAETRIHELAFRDPLTGLPNRASFLEKLVSAIAGNGNARIALIKFNIDHFREVNDAVGHQIADATLQRLATALWHKFSTLGTVARIGGDEFAVIMRDQKSGDVARKFAQEFIAHAKKLLMRHNFTMPLGISGGLAICPEHGDDAETLMKNAKAAMHLSKEQHRGSIVVFDPAMRKAIDEKNALIQRIWAGLRNGQFTLFYQPIVDLRSGKVTALEALMRWNDPERGILPPAHFMVGFEEPELSLALGDLALDRAIRQMRAWIDAGVEFGSVAVNLSTAQFRTGHLAETILHKLDQAHVPPQRLTLEVTETVYMAWGADVVADTVRKLHAAGVGIALDDFGTGYASLAHLRQFPIDKLKIDKSFVQSSESAAIVDAVINMGLSLGMQVVAEGVERPEQLNLLRLKGCDLVQGYVFAKPLEPERVAGYISEFCPQKSTRTNGYAAMSLTA
jgi:diguanylate cyclase (GGDEF)-like protein